MPKTKISKSQIKEALYRHLKEANDCILHFPEERSAHKFASAMNDLINICEERGRY